MCDQHIGYTLSSDSTACEGNKLALWSECVQELYTPIV